MYLATVWERRPENRLPWGHDKRTELNKVLKQGREPQIFSRGPT